MTEADMNHPFLQLDLPAFLVIAIVIAVIVIFIAIVFVIIAVFENFPLILILPTFLLNSLVIACHPSVSPCHPVTDRQ